MASTNDLIGYYRLSKEKRRNGHEEQSVWGWSLQIQQAAVKDLARARCAEILADYRQIETGRRSDRPQLARAIAHAKRARATLVVAKLDRLARNVAFTSALMESGVDFISWDNPHANRLTVHILAAVAEDEARSISQRTKDALAAAKRRGVKLGATRPECRNLTAAARRKGTKASAEAVKRQVDEAYQDLRDLLAALRPAFSYREIADPEPARRTHPPRETLDRRRRPPRLPPAGDFTPLADTVRRKLRANASAVCPPRQPFHDFNAATSTLRTGVKQANWGDCERSQI